MFATPSNTFKDLKTKDTFLLESIQKVKIINEVIDSLSLDVDLFDEMRKYLYQNKVILPEFVIKIPIEKDHLRFIDYYTVSYGEEGVFIEKSIFIPYAIHSSLKYDSTFKAYIPYDEEKVCNFYINPHTFFMTDKEAITYMVQNHEDDNKDLVNILRDFYTKFAAYEDKVENDMSDKEKVEMESFLKDYKKFFTNKVKRSKETNENCVLFAALEIGCVFGIIGYIYQCIDAQNTVIIEEAKTKKVTKEHKTSTSIVRTDKQKSLVSRTVLSIDGKVKYITSNNSTAKNIIRKKYIRTATSWSVMGHYRHYKSGKTVFVNGYLKGQDSSKRKRKEVRVK